jgi:stage III sporulation protein SpoIIIAA
MPWRNKAIAHQIAIRPAKPTMGKTTFFRNIRRCTDAQKERLTLNAKLKKTVIVVVPMF